MKLSNRVATLNGGKIFAYRHCNHLAYESQREADHDCNASRAEKTRAKLDCGAGILYLNGRKPK